MTDNSRHNAPFLTRSQPLFTSIVVLAAYVVASSERFPFHHNVRHILLISSAMHLALFALFNRITLFMWNLANLANLILLGFLLHFTGGILSPFLVLVPLVFIVGSGHHLPYRTTIALITVEFFAIITLEATGLLPALDISPQDVYAHGPTTLIIAAAIAGHMWIAASIYDLTIRGLKEKLEQENIHKAVLIQKLFKTEVQTQIAAIASRVSKDIDPPMNGIRESVRSLYENESLTPDGKQDCRSMISEVDRLLNLNKRLLQYAHNQEASSDPVAIRPKEILRKVVSIMEYYPGATRTQIDLVDETNGEPLLIADGDSMHQASFNILKNAVEALQKHAPPRIIRVGLAKRQGAAEISVWDNGPGIPASLLKKLGHDPLTTKEKGWGVGLLIVHEMMTACKGSVEIESKEGVGTCVRLFFPLADGARAR